MKILIAEDDVVSAKVLQIALESSGHEVVTTDCGESAWAAFDAEPVRVIVSDWMMPGLDGLDFCRQVRARPKTDYTYFILLTANHTGRENLRKAMDAGVDDFLAKPLDREAILMRRSVRALSAVLQSAWRDGGAKLGLRFSRNDAIPSCASGVTAFAAITSTA